MCANESLLFFSHSLSAVAMKVTVELQVFQIAVDERLAREVSVVITLVELRHVGTMSQSAGHYTGEFYTLTVVVAVVPFQRLRIRL